MLPERIVPRLPENACQLRSNAVCQSPLVIICSHLVCLPIAQAIRILWQLCRDGGRKIFFALEKGITVLDRMTPVLEAEQPPVMARGASLVQCPHRGLAPGWATGKSQLAFGILVFTTLLLRAVKACSLR
ncbi:uncharacterized protein J3R85_002166 [Psidium guajava]|nr:uncharacterized protein J3R85_002166 [Psidium guajava]